MAKKYFTRKTLRIPQYDYSSNGYYFITICTLDKKHFFGEVKNEEMYLNAIGKIALNKMTEIRKSYNIEISKYVIMPNHIHMIIAMDDDNTTPLSGIIKKYKEWITKEIGKSIWQRSYYDHVIRNESDYLRIWEYIEENVIKWELDKYYSL